MLSRIWCLHGTTNPTYRPYMTPESTPRIHHSASSPPHTRAPTTSPHSPASYALPCIQCLESTAHCTSGLYHMLASHGQPVLARCARLADRQDEPLALHSPQPPQPQHSQSPPSPFQSPHLALFFILSFIHLPPTPHFAPRNPWLDSVAQPPMSSIPCKLPQSSRSAGWCTLAPAAPFPSPGGRVPVTAVLQAHPCSSKPRHQTRAPTS